MDGFLTLTNHPHENLSCRADGKNAIIIIIIILLLVTAHTFSALASSSLSASRSTSRWPLIKVVTWSVFLLLTCVSYPSCVFKPLSSAPSSSVVFVMYFLFLFLSVSLRQSGSSCVLFEFGSLTSVWIKLAFCFYPSAILCLWPGDPYCLNFNSPLV